MSTERNPRVKGAYLRVESQGPGIWVGCSPLEPADLWQEWPSMPQLLLWMQWPPDHPAGHPGFQGLSPEQEMRETARRTCRKRQTAAERHFWLWMPACNTYK